MPAKYLLELQFHHLSLAVDYGMSMLMNLYSCPMKDDIQHEIDMLEHIIERLASMRDKTEDEIIQLMRQAEI